MAPPGSAEQGATRGMEQLNFYRGWEEHKVNAGNPQDYEPPVHRATAFLWDPVADMPAMHLLIKWQYTHNNYSYHIITHSPLIISSHNIYTFECKKNGKGLSCSCSCWFCPREFSQFTGRFQWVRVQAQAEPCYINVTLKALSQKVLFTHFYWDMCLFEDMNFTSIHPSSLDSLD